MPNHNDLIIVWLCRLWDGAVRRRRPLCEGVPISQQASELLPQLQAREFVPKALLLINLYLRHWHKHLRASLVPLVEAYRTGLETGDLEHATFAIAFHAYHSYLVGRDLTQIEPGMTEYGEAIAQFKQVLPLYINQIYRQVVLNLMGRSEDSCRLVGELPAISA
jgi:histidine kinase